MMEIGSELLLKSDGTFEFGLIYGAADYWAKGTWHRDGNAVILEKLGQERASLFVYCALRRAKRAAFAYSLSAQRARASPIFKCIFLPVAKNRWRPTDSDGAAVFPDEPKAHAVAFEVSVYQIETPPFEIDPANKDFHFEINGEAITQVLF